MSNKTYLGDAVYADFDGENIILTTDHGLRYGPSNKIALDSEVASKLLVYLTRVVLVKELHEPTEIPT